MWYLIISDRVAPLFFPPRQMKADIVSGKNKDCNSSSVKPNNESDDVQSRESSENDSKEGLGKDLESESDEEMENRVSVKI